MAMRMDNLLQVGQLLESDSGRTVDESKDEMKSAYEEQKISSVCLHVNGDTASVRA